MSVQGGLGRCCSGRGFPCVLCVTLVLLALWCLIHSIQRVWQMPGLQVRRGGSRELAEFGSLGVCEEGAPPGIPVPRIASHSLRVGGRKEYFGIGRARMPNKQPAERQIFWLPQHICLEAAQPQF